jgi:hypothetical protein
MKLSDKIKFILEEGAHESFGISSFGTETEVPEVESETVEALDEDIKLSASALRSLVVAHIAERMVNESIDTEHEDLVKYGLMEEKKITKKGAKYISQFLPTIYAS